MYKCEKERAGGIAEKIDEFNKKEITEAVFLTRDYLMKNADVFLILSDGSGAGAFPYCACFSDEKLK